MAQVWTESCQWTTDRNKFVRRYFAGDASYEATSGRAGGPAYNGWWSVYPVRPVPQGNEFIFFCRFRVTHPAWFLGVVGPTVGNIGTGTWWAGCDVFLAASADGRLQLVHRISSGTVVVIAQSPPGTLTFIGTLYGLAGKISIHPSAGTCDLYLDGVAVPGLSGLSGINTAHLGSTTWAGFVTDSYARCDLFVADGTNPTGNDVDVVLPDVRVDYRTPNGNGVLGNGFMGNDGNSVDNFLHVDEITPDDDLTYVQSLDPALDSYTLQDAPVGMQIVGVTSMVTARKTDAGVASLRQGVRAAGVNGLSPNYALAVSYVTYSQQHGTNPAGGLPWTELAFNDAQLLVEKV